MKYLFLTIGYLTTLCTVPVFLLLGGVAGTFIFCLGLSLINVVEGD